MEVSPKAPTQLSYGDTITLTVSQGQDTSDVEVPDLKNKTKEQAKALLEENGLSLGTVTPASSSTVDAGKVIYQDIQAGRSVPRGETISITISTGPEEIPETTTPEPTTTEESYSVSFNGFIISEHLKSMEQATNDDGEVIPYEIKAYISYTIDGAPPYNRDVTELIEGNDENGWKAQSTPIVITVKDPKAKNVEATLTITVNGEKEITLQQQQFR